MHIAVIISSYGVVIGKQINISGGKYLIKATVYTIFQIRSQIQCVFFVWLTVIVVHSFLSYLQKNKERKKFFK